MAAIATDAPAEKAGLAPTDVIEACRTRAAAARAALEATRASNALESAAGARGFRDVRKVLLRCGEHLDMIATKFTVTVEACAQRREDGSWAAALCKSVDASCENLVSSCVVATACSCGRHLRKEVVDAAVGVVNALEAQLACAARRMTDAHRDDARVQKQLTVLTGQVTAACSTLQKLPKSNKGCLKRHVMRAYKQVADVVREQAEMIAESEESPREEDDEGGGGGGGGGAAAAAAAVDFSAMADDEFFDMDFSLSVSEIGRSRQCQQVMERCNDLLKAVAKAVGTCVNWNASSGEAVTAVDAAGDALKTLSGAVNELGVSLCPPQDTVNVKASLDELIAAADCMAEATATIVEDAGGTPGEGKSGVGDATATVLATQEALAALRDAIAGARAAL